MRDVTADNITEIFTGYFGQDTDPQTKEIMTSLARHLHDFVREVDLTHDEWRTGLEIIEWTGRITAPERNKFVLMSDVLALSTLVDTLHSKSESTSSSVLGSFHVSNAPALALGGDMKKDFGGEVLSWIKTSYLVFVTIQ